MTISSRQFLVGGAVSVTAIALSRGMTFASEQESFIRPAVLRSGDTVELITPSRFVVDPARIDMVSSQ